MKKIISCIIIFSFLFTSCSNNKEEIVAQKIEKKSVITQEILADYFTEQIKLIWKVSPLAETQVSAMANWVIRYINTEVGKRVNKWQVLAWIDLNSSIYWTSFVNADTMYNNSLEILNSTESSIKNDLDLASIQLENARIVKENTYDTTDYSYQIAKIQLENINDLNENTKDVSDTSLDLAKKSKETAEINLVNFEKNYIETIKSFETKKQNLNNTIDTNIISSISGIDSAITYVDTILWVSNLNKNYNDAYEIYLWVKNTSTKLRAENDWIKVKDKFDNFNDSELNIDEKLQKIIDLTDELVLVYDDMVKLLENSITSSSFNENSLNNIKLNIKTNQWIVLWIKSSLVNLLNTKRDLDVAISSTTTSLDTNKISLEQAISISETNLLNTINSINLNKDNVSGNKKLLKKQLENTVISIKFTRDNASNTLKLAKANFDSIQSKLKIQKMQARSAVDQAKWWKDLAWIQLNNTLITAPFAWVIISRNIEVWTLVWIWTPTFTVWDDSILKIKLDISSDNISDIKLGEKAEIIKWNKTFSWVVTLISPSADLVTKMFKMEVSFNKKADWINMWDFVDIVINKINWKEKMLLAPLSSIMSLWQWDYSLFVVEDWKARLRQVKIGSQNSSQIQILSWIKKWEKIVISGTLDLQDWDLVEEQK